MYKNTFCVCWGPLMMSGKQAASWDVMRSWGSRLWKAAPSTPRRETHTNVHLRNTKRSMFSPLVLELALELTYTTHVAVFPHPRTNHNCNTNRLINLYIDLYIDFVLLELVLHNTGWFTGSDIRAVQFCSSRTNLWGDGLLWLLLGPPLISFVLASH